MPEENTPTPTPTSVPAPAPAPATPPASGAPTPPPAGGLKSAASLDFKTKAELALKKNQNINGKGMPAGEAENAARKEMGIEPLSAEEVQKMNEKAKQPGLMDKVLGMLGLAGGAKAAAAVKPAEGSPAPAAAPATPKPEEVPKPAEAPKTETTPPADKPAEEKQETPQA